MSDDKKILRSDEELVSHLTDTALRTGGPVAIIAGHYMLAYDDVKERLVPMVWQDTDHPWLQSFSQLMAQDFPVRSFRIGLQVMKQLEAKDCVASLVLLINDHIFQTAAWSNQNLPADPVNHPGSLRHEYYRSKEALPKSFGSLIQEIAPRAKEKVFVRNDNPKRTKSDIIPKKSVFFSEQVLRRRFDGKTRRKLLNDSHFQHIEVTKGIYRVYFRPDELSPKVCMIDEEGCGCSGEVVELLLQLEELNFQTVLFFVPQECAHPVNAGATAATYVLQKKKRRLTVATISGLGGMGVDPNSKTRPPILVKLAAT